MSADSSMGAHTSNTVDTTSQNDINDAAWNPVGDSPLIAPVSATMEVPPIEEIRPVEPAVQAEPANPVQAEQAEQEQVPTEQDTLAAVQEVLSTSNLHVEIPESSESDDDMPPLISSSDEESESDSKESEDDSKEESDDSKESEDDSKEESVDDSEDDSKESDEDLMVAVFPRPTCPRCDAALTALLTPSEESETESSSDSGSGSGSRRAHRIRPKPTEIPTIILTLFKILLFLHIVQFLTTSIVPARRTYS